VNVIAIAAGYDHSVALTSNGWVWTWGNNAYGQLGRSTSPNSYGFTPGIVSALTNRRVTAVAAGNYFTLAVTSNGQAYAWGGNSQGELGTYNYSLSGTNSPMLVPGISNVVFASAQAYGNHVLAVTADHGTNDVWAWGNNDHGQLGAGINPSYTPVDPPVGPPRFCNACIQLGTNGSFTAPSTGTLTLHFNDDIPGDNSGVLTVTVYGVAYDVVVDAKTNAASGVVIGTAYQGTTYNYTATGWVYWDYPCPYRRDDNCLINASGINQFGQLVDCDSMHGSTNPVDPPEARCTPGYPCPGLVCYSLVGKIQ
jgi:hypothetical protein